LTTTHFNSSDPGVNPDDGHHGHDDHHDDHHDEHHNDHHGHDDKHHEKHDEHHGHAVAKHH